MNSDIYGLTFYITNDPLYKTSKCKIPIFDFLEDKSQEVLYILYCKLKNEYKIGYTTSFVQRYQQLQSSSGLKLDVTFLAIPEPSINPDVRFLEKKFKDYFKKKRCIGEWFQLSKRDLVEIRTYLMGEQFWDFVDYNQYNKTII